MRGDPLQSGRAALLFSRSSNRLPADLKFGVREIRRRPGLAASILVALALGIGLPMVALSLGQGGLALEEPVHSPRGLALPPPTVDFETGAPVSEPAPAGDGLFGGEARGRESRQSIAEVQRDAANAILFTLLGAGGVVLLVACSNLVLLLVARGGARRREIAIRGMLGARRLRLVGGLLLEQMPILALGAILGGIVATLTLLVVEASWPTLLPNWIDWGPDPSIAALVLILPVVAVALAAVLPALLLSESDLYDAAGAGARITSSRREGAARDRVTRLAIATSITLLFAAGMLLRGLSGDAAEGAAIGFDPADSITFALTPPSAGSSPIELAALMSSVTAALADAPGVMGVSVSSEGTWLGLGSRDFVHVLTGNPTRPGITRMALYASVSPGSFEAMGAEIVEGREFTADDGAGATAVVVVNRTFANRLFPGTAALGRQVQLGRVSLDRTRFTIVGIVGDLRPPGIGNGGEPEPAIYFSALQVPPTTATAVVRYRGDAESARAGAESAIAQVSESPPGLVYTGSLRHQLAEFRRPLAWFGSALTTLALFAALLAGYGLFGLITFNVESRRREIGIRLALGSPTRSVIGLFLREGMRLTAGGIALGLLGAFTVGRLLQVTYRGVDSLDLPLLLGVVIGVAVVAAFASYLPARAAARIDPARSLTYD
jgi:putative ABC transport system permease protein